MRIGRREFLKITATASTVASLVPSVTGAEVRNGMPYRDLGQTGQKVSLLCVGGFHIGKSTLTDEESIRIMRTAVDEGVNFFDNAWQYNDGVSEIRMGKALKDGYRDRVFLMTKHKGRDRRTAQEHLETSLRRLDVDVIDLWQFHEVINPDDPERIYQNGAIEFAIEAKAQGKIRHIGFTGHRAPAILLEMITRGFAWETLQMPLNPCDPHYLSFEKQVLPKALEKGIGVIAMKTLGGTPGQIPRTGQVTAVECLHYAMNLPVATVCSGMDSMEKFRENLAAAKSFQKLTAERVAALLARTQTIAVEGKYEPYKERV